MRIALAIAGPYPALRGSQVLVRHLTSGLATRGHEIHVVSHGALADERPGLHPGRLVRDLALILRLWRCVRREAVEIIHAHNYEAAIAGLLVARLTGRPLVYHGHNALAEELPTYFQSRLGRRPLFRVWSRIESRTAPKTSFWRWSKAPLPILTGRAPA